MADNGNVVFMSDASNLVADDTNGSDEVFVKNVLTGVTKRVSAAADGTQGDSVSSNPVMSGDGQTVAFMSFASNLVPGAPSGNFDIYVKHLDTGAIERVSTAADGTLANSSAQQAVLSHNGRFVAFMSDASNLVANDTNFNFDIFVKDLQTGKIIRATTDSNGVEANSGADWNYKVADNGNVIFQSAASNLVPNDTNDNTDVFVKNFTTGSTRRVSVAADGTEGER